MHSQYLLHYRDKLRKKYANRVWWFWCLRLSSCVTKEESEQEPTHYYFHVVSTTLCLLRNVPRPEMLFPTRAEGNRPTKDWNHAAQDSFFKSQLWLPAMFGPAKSQKEAIWPLKYHYRGSKPTPVCQMLMCEEKVFSNNRDSHGTDCKMVWLRTGLVRPFSGGLKN